MNQSRLIKLAAFLALLSCHSPVFAAAYQLYELGTPVIGTAAVGQAALADDASTAYFNPAGMPQLPGTEVMLGTQFMLPYMNFTPNRANTVSGNNGGSAGSLVPGLGAYFAFHYSPALSFGLSINSPYGGLLNYNNHWVGRYVIQQSAFYAIDVNPSIAYQVNSWLSVGGGIVFEYANLSQTLALRLSPLIDGQANLRLDNTAPGFNLGVLLKPTESTKVGIAYRSQVVHHMNGNTNFLNIGLTPVTQTKMVMPASVIASLVQHLNTQFTLLAELGYANWSSMHDTIVTIAGFSAVTPNNWNNTYRAGLGGSYQLNHALLLQAGVSYDSSPTTASKRLPDLPMDRQIRVGAGIVYALVKAASFGLSYEYINFGQASITNTSAYGVLSGNYSRNYANVLQLSLNVSC